MINEDNINRQVQRALSNLPVTSKECCIYGVPRHLRAANESAYMPLVVSIGPLHRHADHLQHTHLHKLNYLNSFLRARDTGTKKPKSTIYVELITGHLSQIQECYAEPSVRTMDAEELVFMVLVDAAFLIELFRRSHDPSLIEANDQMFHRPRMVVEVGHDVRLEENQLPLFILRELYNAAYAYGGHAARLSFMEIACEFLGVSRERISRHGVGDNCKHFLDLLRANLLPERLRHKPLDEMANNGNNSNNDFVAQPKDVVGNPPQRRRDKKGPLKTIMCNTATALNEAGVRFRAPNHHDSGKCSLLDIKFDVAKRTLTIPRIIIQDDTEALFRNLAVYEQWHYFTDSYIIDYILFLDFLINTPSDVALLAKQGIIENWLGSEERVAELFNGLSRQLRLRTENFYYAEQSDQLIAFYKRRWNHYRAVLRHKYFNHPWAAISVAYAVVLLILTVLQVFTGFESLK